MNIKDVKGKIIDKSEDHSFSRELSQDEDVVQELLALREIGTHPVYVVHLAKKYGLKYYLGGIRRTGSKITNIQVYERNYVGDQYRVEYRGLQFLFYCAKNGDVLKAEFAFWATHATSSHISIYNTDTFDECYEQALVEVEESKRSATNSYKREIDLLELKYKKELKRHNDILKWEKENEDEKD